MTPAIVPMTIPAMAPALRPPLLVETIGTELPLAVAGGRKDWVVVAETIDVAVEIPLLVGRNGAEKDELATKVQLETKAVHTPADSHR